MSEGNFSMIDESEIERVEEVVMQLTTVFLQHTSLSPLIISTAAFGIAQFLILNKELSEGEVSAIHLCLNDGGRDLKAALLMLAPRKLKRILG